MTTRSETALTILDRLRKEVDHTQKPTLITAHDLWLIRTAFVLRDLDIDLLEDHLHNLLMEKYYAGERSQS